MQQNENVRPQKAAMLVAKRIMRDVGRQGLGPGDLLPPERTMLEKYEIGRGTLREALRLLEFQGAISLKPGPKGGPVLLDPDPSHLASMVQLVLQLKKAPFRSIIEVRSAIEPTLSALAATRMSEDELAALEQTIVDMRDRIEDTTVFFEANQRFHEILAYGSGNPLLSYFLDSLLGIMDGTVIGIDYPPHRRTAILKAHEELFEFLVRRDPVGSEQRMREHIDAYVEYAERRYADVLDQTVQWDT